MTWKRGHMLCKNMGPLSWELNEGDTRTRGHEDTPANPGLQMQLSLIDTRKCMKIRGSVVTLSFAFSAGGLKNVEKENG